MSLVLDCPLRVTQTDMVRFLGEEEKRIGHDDLIIGAIDACWDNGDVNDDGSSGRVMRMTMTTKAAW